LTVRLIHHDKNIDDDEIIIIHDKNGDGDDDTAGISKDNDDCKFFVIEAMKLTTE